jgi:2-methylisocitrate lyase-like PEP mutase family enzyme
MTTSHPLAESALRRLRALLSAPGMLVAPGGYDAITARAIERAGFPAVYMTGAGASAAMGFPDYGLLTLTEMAESAGAMARSISVPLIADADTGYGNELNVTRTVREYEGRGVAGIHIEDQVSPKRCGHLDGKTVVGREEFVSKIRAAVAAKRDPDFLIIARTDARAVIGFEEATARANLALAAGADMAFVEAVETLEEMEAVPKTVEGPCLLNVVFGGKTPVVSLPAAEAMGYRLAILPGMALRAVMPALDTMLKALMETQTLPTTPPGASAARAFRRFGSDEWDALRRTYSQPEA